MAELLERRLLGPSLEIHYQARCHFHTHTHTHTPELTEVLISLCSTVFGLPRHQESTQIDSHLECDGVPLSIFSLPQEMKR